MSSLWDKLLEVADDVVHCVGLSKVKFGEVVSLKINFKNSK